MTTTIPTHSIESLMKLFGNYDENLEFLHAELGVEITLAGGELSISGEDERVALAETVIIKLLDVVEREAALDKTRIRYVIDLVKEGRASEMDELMNGVVAVTARGKQIKCKTLGQKKYISAIKKNTVVFGIGPAGTGKTYLAVAMAVSAYKNKEVDRIILTRPAVEAGEKLGFLPGDLQNKVDPYLRPLYDALSEMLGYEVYQRMLERGTIEVAPLAYMRGRTLNNSYIILDEAQNTTREQMKMFLTRLGEGSKIIVTGDVTQIDLPTGVKSGLKDAAAVLKDVEGIDIVYLTPKDVVRHELVMNIVRAYEKYNGGRS